MDDDELHESFYRSEQYKETAVERYARLLADVEPNDGPGLDGRHVITGECFACMVGIWTGPESHADDCAYRGAAPSDGAL